METNQYGGPQASPARRNTFCLTAKLTLSWQNLLSQGKTYSLKTKLTLSDSHVKTYNRSCGGSALSQRKCSLTRPGFAVTLAGHRGSNHRHLHILASPRTIIRFCCERSISLTRIHRSPLVAVGSDILLGG